MPPRRRRKRDDTWLLLLLVLGALLPVGLALTGAVAVAGLRASLDARYALPPEETPDPTLAPAATATPIPLQVLVASASVEPSFFEGACPTEVTLVGALTTNGAPGEASVRWRFSDQTVSSEQTVSFQNGDTSMTATATWSVGSPGQQGTAWAVLEVLAPPGLSSERAEIVYACAPATTDRILVTFSGPVDPGTLEPADFEVNGTPVVTVEQSDAQPEQAILLLGTPYEYPPMPQVEIVGRVFDVTGQLATIVAAEPYPR